MLPSLFVLNDNFDISDHVLVLSTRTSTNVPMLINTNGEFSSVRGESLNLLHIASQSWAVSFRPNIFKCLKADVLGSRLKKGVHTNFICSKFSEVGKSIEFMNNTNCFRQEP